MPALTKFNIFTKDLIDGKHNFSSNTFKLALTNTAPVAGNTVLANITQIANGNGYTTGGATCTVTPSTTGGVSKIVIDDVVFTATGAVGPFRYAVLYNDTASGDPLIGYIDHGTAVTMANEDTHTFDFNGTDGAIVI